MKLAKMKSIYLVLYTELCLSNFCCLSIKLSPKEKRGAAIVYRTICAESQYIKRDLWQTHIKKKLNLFQMSENRSMQSVYTMDGNNTNFNPNISNGHTVNNNDASNSINHNNNNR